MPAARIFGNYVFMPAAGHPGKRSVDTRTHGAALLVFADQVAEKIELGARNAAHVAGEIVIVPAKKLVDESMSSHATLENKKGHSMAELHCTTCDASLPAGALRCPGCGLQLTTQAAPAVYVERARFPLWGILLVSAVAFVIFANIWSRHTDAKAADAQAAFAADLAGGQLNTAEAFEARCGQPRWTKSQNGGSELHYFASNGADYFITLTPSGMRLEQEKLDGARVYRINVSAEQIYIALGCK